MSVIASAALPSPNPSSYNLSPPSSIAPPFIPSGPPTATLLLTDPLTSQAPDLVPSSPFPTSQLLFPKTIPQSQAQPRVAADIARREAFDLSATLTLGVTNPSALGATAVRVPPIVCDRMLNPLAASFGPVNITRPAFAVPAIAPQLGALLTTALPAEPATSTPLPLLSYPLTQAPRSPLLSSPLSNILPLSML